MSTSQNQTTLPAPYIVKPTERWDGDDGNWTTFSVEVGTPSQSFRLLPSTLNSGIWIPFVEGCAGTLAPLSNCGDLRGANTFNGAASSGFYRNESDSWSLLGIYDLESERDRFSDPGLFGRETISVGRQPGSTAAPELKGQLVAGISTEDFWLGSIGLGIAASNFNNISIPSLLVSLKNQSLVPSLSYAYTAGQAYRNTPGSLILGGYDATRLSSSVLTTTINSTAAPHQLELKVQSIVASSTLSGATRGLLPQPITASIDTTVSQLWLPKEVCDNFVDAFGLIYDESTSLYLVNYTLHNQLRSNNASITFIVGGPDASGSTNIVMYYDAFDLEVGIPLYNSSRPYFPIRRAANESQITLGRAFMQEAYLVVDWERNNFTIGPVEPVTGTSNIVAISPPANPANPATTAITSSPASQPSQPSGLGIGAVAGIIVTVMAILTIAAAFGFFFWRRRYRYRQVRKSLESQAPEPHGNVEYHPGGIIGTYDPSKTPEMAVTEVSHERKRSEIMSTPIHELPSPLSEKELMSTSITELVGDDAGSELDDSSINRSSRQSDKSQERTKSPLSRNVSVHEMA